MTENRTIWKFPLGYKGQTTFGITVPRDSEPRRVDMDRTGELVLWAEVTPGDATETVWVTVVGTGQPIPESAGTYLNTFLLDPFVFHAYVLTTYRARIEEK